MMVGPGGTPASWPVSVTPPRGTAGHATTLAFSSPIMASR
jgi:hypothetical protein